MPQNSNPTGAVAINILDLNYYAQHRVGAVLVFALVSILLVLRAPGIDHYFFDYDHGALLAMGSQILLGRYPYIDFLSVYGPMTSWLSAASLSTGSLWLETLICTLCYSISITLVYLMLRKHFRAWVAFLTIICAIWLLGRFHKWFIWLFPLALLYCYQCYLVATHNKFGWWWLAGAVAGLGALFRLEFGLAYLAVFALLAVAERRQQMNPLRFFRQTFGRFLLAFSLVMFIWLALLFYHGGFQGLYNYLIGTVIGGNGAVADWSMSPPAFSTENPISASSAAAIAYKLLPFCYLVCIAYGFLPGGRCIDTDAEFKSFSLAVGIMGMAMFPHGYYRADIPHLRQTLACALIAVPMTISILWMPAFVNWPSVRLLFRIACVSTLATTLIWGSVLLSGPQLDWQPLFSDFRARLSTLNTLDPETSNTPQAMLATAISNLSQPEEAILLVATLPQLYCFTARRISGLNPFYFKGIFDSGEWAAANQRRIDNDPPALVVVDRVFLKHSKSPTAYLPDALDAYLHQHYRNVVFELGDWVILAAENRK